MRSPQGDIPVSGQGEGIFGTKIPPSYPLWHKGAELRFLPFGNPTLRTRNGARTRGHR
nr:MAG TPA: hypothetical protein [Caudoviricetes sp.]